MRIEKCHLYSFGQIREASYHFQPGLNIVEGLNESGKTTLLAFIRGILFGFAGRRYPERRYEPPKGGTFGGALVLADDEGKTYRVERIYRKKVAGDVTVQLPDGGQADEAFLRQLLGQMNEKVFNNIFAFGLSELQEIDSLREDEMNHFIYTAGTGDGKAIRGAQKWLEERERELFRPYGSKSKVNVSLQKMHKAQRQLNQLKEENERYELLVADLQEWDRRLRAQETSVEAIRRQMTALEAIRDHYDEYIRYIDLQERLARLPELDVFPEDGIARLDALNEKIRENQVELSALTDRYQRLKEQLSLPPHHDTVIECQLDIEELRDNLTRFREHCESIERSRANIQRENERFEGIVAQLGPAWDREKVAAFDTSLATKRAVRMFDTSLAERKTALSLAENERTKVEQEMEERGAVWREWRAREAARPAKSKAVLEEEARGLTRAQRLSQQGEALASRVTFLQEKIKSYSDIESTLGYMRNGKKSTSWVWGGLAVTSLSLLILWATDHHFLAVIAIILFASLAGWGLRQKSTTDTSTNDTISDVSKKKEQAEKDLAGVQAEAADVQVALMNIRHQFSREETTLYDWEQQLGQEREQWRRWERWHEQWIEKENELMKAQTLYTRAGETWSQRNQNYREQKQRWREWLEARGMADPDDDGEALLMPELVMDMMRDLELAKEAIRRMDELMAMCREYEQLTSHYLNKLQTVLARVEIAEANGTAEFQVRELARLLEQSFAEKRQYHRLRKQLQTIEEQRLTVEHRLGHLTKERTQLLRQGSSTDEKEYRLRHKQYRERRKLEQEQAPLERSLTRLSREVLDTETEDLGRLLTLMGRTSKGEVEENWRTLQANYKEARQQLYEGQNERAALVVKIEQLTSGTGLSEHQQRYEQLASDLRQQVKEWAVTTLGRHYLQRAIHVYEQEKQPEVLKEASRYLHVLTDGRYRRVLAPVGEQTIEVERHDGQRLEPAFLSRGTAEQVYLAMRFALTETYTKQARLPLVLDDILVNFDPIRTRAAVRTLQLLADTRQILFFTCHEHLCHLFAEEDVPHHRIHLDAQAHPMQTV